MYLQKNNNEIIINNLEDIPRHYQYIIVNILNGEFENSTIKSRYKESEFSELIEYISSRNIVYSMNKEAKENIEKLANQRESFEDFSRTALNIKNNLSNANKKYISFITVIDKIMIRKLYDFQARAAYHMAFSINSCNFSVPGAGKTSIVYAAYAYLKNQGIVNKLVIIGPLSAYLAWDSEYISCFGKEARITNLSQLNHSEKMSYLKYHSSLKTEIEFINYEGFKSLVNDFDKHLKESNTMLVLDEAHKIKNPSALRSKQIMNIANSAKSRVILTGTPMPNGYQDLLNLFNFVWPGKNLVKFKLNYLKNLSRIATSYDIEKLMNNIEPYYIRVTKKQLDLPEPVFNYPIQVKMKPIQEKIYKYIKDDFLSSNFIDSELAIELKKSKIIRLLQALTNPASINLNRKEQYSNEELFHLIQKYEELEVPPKYEKLIDLLRVISDRNEKVIIWSIYTHNINSLKRFLGNYNFASEILNGETENEERLNIIRKFHVDDNLKVLIANPSAVAESISLHKICKNAIYLEKNFNAAQYMQSKDRIHRVGLKPNDKINYYFLLTENSIDEIVHRRVLEKESSMLNIIEGKVAPLFNEDFISDLSDSDVEAIEKYFIRDEV